MFLDPRHAPLFPSRPCLPSRSGDGGHGESIEAGRGRWVDNFKYRPGKSIPKKIWLAASEGVQHAGGG